MRQLLLLVALLLLGALLHPTDATKKAWSSKFHSKSEVTDEDTVPKADRIQHHHGWLAQNGCHSTKKEDPNGHSTNMLPSMLDLSSKGLTIRMDNKDTSDCDSKHWRSGALYWGEQSHFGRYSITAKMPHYKTGDSIPKAYWFWSLWNAAESEHHAEQILFQWTGEKGRERNISAGYNLANLKPSPPHTKCGQFHLSFDPREHFATYTIDWRSNQIIWTIKGPLDGDVKTWSCHAITEHTPDNEKNKIPKGYMSPRIILRAMNGYNGKPVYVNIKSASFTPAH